MRVPRIHLTEPLAPGSSVALPAQAGDHLLRVLRMAEGDPVIVFNGDGREYAGLLDELSRRRGGVSVIEELPARSSESPLALTLVQAIARGEKMHWILQKATELGAAAIVPIVTERTEVKLDAERAERRIAHWQAVIVSACEQSGRVRLPLLAQPQRLTEWAAGLGDDGGLRLILDPAAPMSLRELPHFERASLVIGPEGGLSDRDLHALRQAGFHGRHLGPRILRTETAGISALAALQALYGDC